MRIVYVYIDKGERNNHMEMNIRHLDVPILKGYMLFASPLWGDLEDEKPIEKNLCG